MAGVSAEYYTRIEQGRVRPSTQVVDAIAEALGLVEPERRHLQALVRPAAVAAPQVRAIPPVIEQIFASLTLPRSWWALEQTCSPSILWLRTRCFRSER